MSTDNTLTPEVKERVESIKRRTRINLTENPNQGRDIIEEEMYKGGNLKNK